MAADVEVLREPVGIEVSDALLPFEAYVLERFGSADVDDPAASRDMVALAACVIRCIKGQEGAGEAGNAADATAPDARSWLEIERERIARHNPHLASAIEYVVNTEYHQAEDQAYIRRSLEAVEGGSYSQEALLTGMVLGHTVVRLWLKARGNGQGIPVLANDLRAPITVALMRRNQTIKWRIRSEAGMPRSLATAITEVVDQRSVGARDGMFWTFAVLAEADPAMVDLLCAPSESSTAPDQA